MTDTFTLIVCNFYSKFEYSKKYILRKVMPKNLHEQCKKQTWMKIKIVEGLPEGKGVFAISDIPRGTYVCNYGGSFLSIKYCEKNLLPFEEKCNYLVEMKENINGKWEKVFLNHDEKTVETFGKLLNHSRIHPNVKCKVFAIEEEQLIDILFITLRDVKKGEQLVWDYGPNFSGVDRCVQSCSRCKLVSNKEGY